MVDLDPVRGRVLVDQRLRRLLLRVLQRDARQVVPALLRLLEARLPSLDKTPMTNPATGCITVPGSPCREGGYRILDGDLRSAVDAFTRGRYPKAPHTQTVPARGKYA